MSVYFIRAEGTPHVKIGRAINVNARMRELQCANPAQLSLLRVIDGDAAQERQAHIHFAAYRVAREWFVFTEEMLVWQPTAQTVQFATRRGSHPLTGPVKLAVEAAGGVGKLAAALGLSSQAVSQWTRIPAMRTLTVERLTGVPCYVLRPDLYPPEDYQGAAA